MLLNQQVPQMAGVTQVRAVIFDWAGTTVDFGSLAPVRTLERVFGEAGVPITEQEARQDMGIAKLDHIKALLSIPRIRQAWRAARGRDALAEDVQVLYHRFLPLQLECLERYSKLINGVPELVQRLRSYNIKIGSTTGYTREMLDLLIAKSSAEGYLPDCSFSPEDVGAGRPAPFMIYAAAVKMQVYPLSAIIKVGDTVSDIREGLNAGTWSVGVAGTGNAVGLAEDKFQMLESAERTTLVQKARNQLQAAGAHYVLETLAEMDLVIQDIQERFHMGQAA